MLNHYDYKPGRIDWCTEYSGSMRAQVYRHEGAWNELDRGHDEYDHLCDLFGGHTCDGYRLATEGLF